MRSAPVRAAGEQASDAPVPARPALILAIICVSLPAFGGLLLLGARTGDLFGHRRMFLLSLVVFSVASLLVGAALGLVVGELVADLVSWRAGFLLNVPIGVLMFALAARFLPETVRQRGRFDVLGALLATLGAASLVLGIVEASTLVLLGAGAVLLGLFLLAERRAAQPIVPLRLFASRERGGAYLARMLYMGGMTGFFFFTAQFVQSVYDWTPLRAGLSFLPMTLVNFALAVCVPRLIDRIGASVTLVTGVALTAAGMVWLSRLGLGTPYATGVALPMVLIGAGQGLALAPLTSSGVAGVAPGDVGAGSGPVNTVHQLGSALSLSILTAPDSGVRVSWAGCRACPAASRRRVPRSPVRSGRRGGVVPVCLPGAGTGSRA